MKLDVTDKSIQKVTSNIGFGVKSDIGLKSDLKLHSILNLPIAVGALIQYLWLNTLIHAEIHLAEF